MAVNRDRSSDYEVVVGAEGDRIIRARNKREEHEMDYADIIAKRVMEDAGLSYPIPADPLWIMVAEAAREGYNLAMGVKA